MEGETLAFVLDVANEDGDAWGGRSAPAYIAWWDEPQPSDQNRLETMVEMRCRGRLEAIGERRGHFQVGLGRPAPLVSLRASPLL
jgi:hypothetical protein